MSHKIDPSTLPSSFLQENYFGEDDMYTDFEEAVSSPVLSSLSTSSTLGWSPLGLDDDGRDGATLHPLALRPWEITVLINLYKVHGRLPMVSPSPPTPATTRNLYQQLTHYVVSQHHFVPVVPVLEIPLNPDILVTPLHVCLDSTAAVTVLKPPRGS